MLLIAVIVKDRFVEIYTYLSKHVVYGIKYLCTTTCKQLYLLVNIIGKAYTC